MPVVDTWWQTETGQIMISPLPGVTAGKPGSAMKALPGVGADVVNDEGESVPNGSGGFLVLTKPWPAMLRTLWGDDERFKETYWARFADQGFYFAGDGAKKDDDGDLWLLGRVDDVMNVSGHRLSTTEIESALVSHPKVAEAAVVGAADETTGQAVCAFVILRESAVEEADEPGEGADLVQELRNHVAKEIGSIAKPRQIMIVPELPKTRSGKIMRRLLKDVAEHREVGDVTTLADSTVMDLIKDKEGARSGGGLSRPGRPDSSADPCDFRTLGVADESVWGDAQGVARKRSRWPRTSAPRTAETTDPARTAVLAASRCDARRTTGRRPAATR